MMGRPKSFRQEHPLGTYREIVLVPGYPDNILLLVLKRAVFYKLCAEPDIDRVRAQCCMSVSSRVTRQQGESTDRWLADVKYRC